MTDSFSEMRRRNATRVLELIREHGELSRADLARMTDLSKATVSSITSDLLESDLVVETGSLSADKGRKPVGLVFNPLARVACGVAIDDENNYTIVITDMNGTPVARHAGRAASDQLEADSLLKSIREVMRKSGFEPSRLSAVGLAAPGPLDEQKALYFAIADILSRKLKQHVMVQSLVDMAAIAEAKAGNLPADRLVLFVRLSHQLRSTLLLGRKLVFMHGKIGGDIGHIAAPWIEGRCTCGNKSCVNLYAGSEQLIERAKQNGADVADVAGLVNACHAGDVACRDTIGDAGYAVGYVLGCMMNVMSPLSIFVAGPASEAGDAFWKPLRDACNKYALPANYDASELHPSALGSDSPAFGAALYALASQPVLD